MHHFTAPYPLNAIVFSIAAIFLAVVFFHGEMDKDKAIPLWFRIVLYCLLMLLIWSLIYVEVYD